VDRGTGHDEGLGEERLNFEAQSKVGNRDGKETKAIWGKRSLRRKYSLVTVGLEVTTKV
jgi:hypothetical protein